MRSALDRQVLGTESRLQIVPRYGTQPAAIDDQVLRGSRRRIGVGDGDTVDPTDVFVNPVAIAPDGTISINGQPQPNSNSTPVNWTSVINTADTSLANVFKTLFAPPTLIQTAQGTIYRAPDGESTALPLGSSLFGSAAGASSLLPILLLAGGALLLFSMAGKH